MGPSNLLLICLRGILTQLNLRPTGPGRWRYFQQKPSWGFFFFFCKYEDWTNDLFKSLSTPLVLCWGKHKQWHLLANKNARWKFPVQYPSFQNCLGWARTGREGNWTKLLRPAVWHRKWLQTVVQPSPNSTVFPKGTTATKKESPSQMVFLLSEGHCFVLFACLDFNSLASHVH